MSLPGRKDTGMLRALIRCGLYYQVGRIPGKIMWRWSKVCQLIRTRVDSRNYTFCNITLQNIVLCVSDVSVYSPGSRQKILFEFEQRSVGQETRTDTRQGWGRMLPAALQEESADRPHQGTMVAPAREPVPLKEPAQEAPGPGVLNCPEKAALWG